LRLIPNIVVLPYRNPFVVAKSDASLDVLSGGRFILTVGVGYLKREFAALDVITKVQRGRTTLPIKTSTDH
jgi:alkanesulfonate monooxygenase SsuD/methylene tetrahydromethanopterin reductase-like flavin-dependent oxidoreductase (luciferase family)